MPWDRNDITGKGRNLNEGLSWRGEMMHNFCQRMTLFATYQGEVRISSGYLRVAKVVH